MSTIENGESTAGRVTRSLRKRITSIDSDAPSRPETPINLQTISDTATPLKRITRRTSLSTPIATPSKVKSRIDISEVSNSPARRTARLRSVSVQEQELAVQFKPKELTIDAVKEEETETEKTPENRRVTRSSSKSPLEAITLQSKISSSKNSAKKNSIEQEVINLDDSLDSLGQSVATSPLTTQNKKQTKVRIKKEKNIDVMIQASPINQSQLQSKCTSIHKEDDVEELEIPSKSVTKQKTPQKDSNNKQSSASESNTEQMSPRKSDIDQIQNRKSNTAESSPRRPRGRPRTKVSLEKENPPTLILSNAAKTQLEDGSPQKKKLRPENLKNVAFNETADEDTIKSVYPKTPGLPKSKSYILDSSKDLERETSNKDEKSSDKEAEDEDNVTNVVQNTYKLTLKTIESSTPIKSASPMKNTSSAVEEQQKKLVEFNNSTDDRRTSITDGEKNVVNEYNETISIYNLKLKTVDSSTPIKTASTTENKSSAKEKEKKGSTPSNNPTDGRRKSNADGEKNVGDEYNETLRTYSLKLKTIESSAPVKITSPKKNTSSAVESESANENGDTEAVVAFPKSWSHSVSGTVNEAAKIDTIKSEESMRKQLEEEEALKKTQSFTTQNRSKQKANTFDDSDDDSDDLLEEDDENDEDMEEEEERNQEKSIFIDDEAMEVPEGEQSMDSEERQYLEENEVPVYGESIGSEDSEEDDDCEEEAQEEDDGFIVSDSEDVVLVAEESDSNEEIEELENENKKRKTYKRIMRYSESSNEEDNCFEIEDKDFRLITDSSLEDGKTKKKLDSSKRDELEKINVEEVGPHTIKTDDTIKKATPNQRNLQVNEEDIDKVNKKGGLGDALNFNNPSRRLSSKKSEEDDGTESLKNSGDTSKASTPNRQVLLTNIEEDEKKDTPNRRNSLTNDKIVDASKTPKLDVLNKRTSLKNAEKQDNESNTDKEGEEQDKKTRKNSLNKGDVGTEPNRNSNTESKRLSKSESKSLNGSKVNRSMQAAMSDAEMEDGATEDAETMNGSKNTFNKTSKSLNKSKPDISPSEDDFEEHNPEPSYKHHNVDTTGAEIANTSKNASRKSLKMSSTESEDHKDIGSPKQNQNVSWKSSRMSLKSNSELCQSETDKNTLPNQTRKSLNNVPKDTSREPEVNEEFRQEKLNVSRKSLNDSKNLKRKSLTRNSTEEEENEEEEKQSLDRRSLNKSKLEKSFQCYEEGSEQEETLTASEVPSETSGGRSLNSSRRSRKSLNRSKLSLENDEGPSPDDEPELKEIDFKKPERKSVNRNISLRVYPDSEEENDDENDDEARFSEEEEEEQPEAETEEYQKNAAEKSTVMEFLGEEEDKSQSHPQCNLNSSRRKSMNESKLDETFQLESKVSSVPMHDSLHRSIMRKSLNQSKLLKEAIEGNKNVSESEEDGARYSDNLVDSSEEEQVVVKKELPKRGLSVSVSNIDFKKKKNKDGEKAIRNSFTIGVSVRNPSSGHKSSPPPSSESDESENDKHVFSEQEDLENLKNVHHTSPYKSRKSLSTSLVRRSSLVLEDSREQKRIKRTSLYLQDKSPSQSFVENITKEKQKTESKRKRESNSFCAVLAPSVEKEDEQKIPKSEIKQKQSCQSESKTNIQHILSRCDEILEAANLAKREAKLNSKKSKVKKPKWMDKEEKALKEENEVKIPLVSRKELKRKDKMKKELAKAIKHSTAMLKIIDPKLGKKLKATPVADVEQSNDNPRSAKRLPSEFLEALEVPLPKQKKSKEIEFTPPSDKENSKKSSNKGIYTKSDIPVDKKKKKRDKEILQTASGTVIVEPVTPKKLRFQHGFRESPKSPVGFKIQDINSAGQSERDKSRQRGKKLFTASGEFIEEDLSISNAKTNSKKGEKTHKRKRNIEEPVYSLPKTQWTPSGMFVEEDLYTSRPLANSTATQFMVTSLNGGKKKKNPSTVVSLATLNNALSFKQNALFNDKVRRETSRELIHRKQRKLANNQY